jgi:hypothetical protein
MVVVPSPECSEFGVGMEYTTVSHHKGGLQAFAFRSKLPTLKGK